MEILKLALFCAFFVANVKGIKGSNATALPGCTIYRQKFRTCFPLGATCKGADSVIEKLDYSTCPVLTQSQLKTILSDRQVTQQTQLNQVSTQTQTDLETVKTTYATSIATSNSFGYIAGIFIACLFFVPILLDIHKIIIHFCDTKSSKNLSQKRKKNILKNSQHPSNVI